MVHEVHKEMQVLIPFVANPVPKPLRKEGWSLLPRLCRGPWQLRKGSRSARPSASLCAGHPVLTLGNTFRTDAPSLCANSSQQQPNYTCTLTVLQTTLEATSAFCEEQISVGLCWVCYKSTWGLRWLNGFRELVHELGTNLLSPVQTGQCVKHNCQVFLLTRFPWVKAEGECQAPQPGENRVHNAELQAPREQ